MNVYHEKSSGDYYYSEKPKDKDDEEIESNVSVEYAYGICAHRNFGVNSASVSKHNGFTPQHHPNENWRKENKSMRRFV
ncbi:MAG: hypothetical protein WC998_08670 [Candidatus Paceibacterota bacterium]|jgi:hypothetical protein